MADPEWTKALGEKVHERRRQKGLSLQKLADKVGTTNCTLSNIENGKHCPSSHLLFKIARAMGCQMDYFYGEIKAEMQARF